MRTKNEDTLQAILDFINTWYFEYNDYPTLGKIAEKLNIGKTTAHRYVTTLIERGEVDKNSRYGNLQTKEITKVMKDRMDKFPLVGEIACGTPILAEENIEAYISFSRELLGSGNFFILRAKGNSMIKLIINVIQGLKIKSHARRNKANDSKRFSGCVAFRSCLYFPKYSLVKLN